MQNTIARYDQLTRLLSGNFFQNIMLIFVRVALAGIFWFSGRSKVAEGTWFTISENTLYQFDDTPFNHVPLPSILAANISFYAEHVFPVLLVIGLFTRMSALALLGMTLVIQIFVFPEAWWQVHIIWVALTLVLITRGAGHFSFDHLCARRRT